MDTESLNLSCESVAFQGLAITFIPLSAMGLNLSCESIAFQGDKYVREASKRFYSLNLSCESIAFQGLDPKLKKVMEKKS